MLFAEFVQLLHKSIEKGTGQVQFTQNLLNHITVMEDLINYSDSTYKGFYNGKTEGKGKEKKIVGDTINQVAKTIYHCLDKQKFKHYLDNLEFNMAAKNELCDSFRSIIPDININNVSNRLAELLVNIIENAANSQHTNDTKPKLQSSSITDSYIITDNEKNVMKNICRVIESYLKIILHLTNQISNIEFELKSNTDLKQEEKWKEYLECELNSLKVKHNDTYAKLEDICSDFVKLYGTKKILHRSIEQIYNIAINISNDKYKITCPKAFKYTSFSVMINAYKQNYDMLIQNIDKL